MGRKDFSDFDAGRTGLSVAGLSDGETLEIQAFANAYLADTQESDEAIHVPCRIVNAPDGFTDMSGEPIQETDGESGKEYNIINSSTGFYSALVDAVGENGETAGERLSITARQPGEETTTRYYEIETE